MNLRSLLEARSQMLRCIRDFFHERQVLEVTTPVLGHSAGTDPAIETFVTRYQGPGSATGLPLYLQTSPEFFMKRLLAAGSGAIYQIAQVFRNGESGARHNPEFSLLEWYRPGFDEHRLMDEVAGLVNAVLERSLAVEKCSYCTLFEQQFGWHPLQVSLLEMRQSARERGIAIDTELSRDQWLDLFMSTLIEPGLGQRGLTFVIDYPSSQASLAQLNQEDPCWARRFELYYQGVELANGFYELSDADEQQRRFEADNHERRRNGQVPQPVDQALLDALKQGLPDCSGVALGLDRLLMLKLEVTSLDKVLPFSFPRL